MAESSTQPDATARKLVQVVLQRLAKAKNQAVAEAIGDRLHARHAGNRGDRAMTLKQRIRYVMDGLAPGVWLTTSGIFERLTDTTYASVQTVITAMYRADQLRRRGNPPRCEYRAGRKPVVPKKFGRPARQRMGFQALARLEKSDPAAYAAFVAEDQKRI